MSVRFRSSNHPIDVRWIVAAWIACSASVEAQQLLCHEYGPAGSGFGFAVAGGEDLDGDGRDEFLVGAPQEFFWNIERGSVRVFSADCQERFVIWGDSEYEEFGAAVAMLSDIDGDGLGDIAVGAPGADAAGFESGRVSVYSGGKRTLLYSVHGSGGEARFGSSLARADDVDGDGVEDWIGGAPGSAVGGPNSGSAIVVSGRGGAIWFRIDGEHAHDGLGFSVGGVGDVDRDGLGDCIVGVPYADANGSNSGRALVFSGASGALLHAVDGRAAGNQLGYAVAILDDLDGDGHPEFGAGSPFDDSADKNAGSASIYSGRDGSLLQRLLGMDEGLQLGWSLTSVGDSDADGVRDMLVGGSGLTSDWWPLAEPGSTRERAWNRSLRWCRTSATPMCSVVCSPMPATSTRTARRTCSSPAPAGASRAVAYRYFRDARASEWDASWATQATDDSARASRE